MLAATQLVPASISSIPRACPVVFMLAATQLVPRPISSIPRACPVVPHARSYSTRAATNLLDTTGLSRGPSCSQLLNSCRDQSPRYHGLVPWSPHARSYSTSLTTSLFDTTGLSRGPSC